MLILPFEPSRGAYEFTTRIEDAEYFFFVRWNAHKLGGWYFDIADETGAAERPRRLIARGLKIVLGIAIGRWIQHPLFAGGAFIAIDTTQSGRDAGYDDLGKRVEVRYYTLDELAALNATALEG
jgi:hypothetical protein